MAVLQKTAALQKTAECPMEDWMAACLKTAERPMEVFLMAARTMGVFPMAACTTAGAELTAAALKMAAAGMAGLMPNARQIP